MNWVEKLNRVPGRVPLLGSEGEAPSAVEVLHWAYSPALPDNVPHRHTYFEVCLIGERGGGEFRVGSRPTVHRIGAGDLFIARPGVIHQIVNDPTLAAMELYWVSFSLESVAKSLTHFTRFAESAEVLVVPDTGGRLASLWKTLRTVTETAFDNDPTLPALTAALLTAIAHAATPTSHISARETDPRDPAFVAVRFIHEHMGRQNLSVPDVAAAVHVSPRHLSRLFAVFTGVTPAVYIEQARLERAHSLLLRTDDPIKQVAVLVGYRDVYQFTRAFTRRFGVPPGKFRAAGLSNNG